MIFIDLARALAVVLMLYGHAVDALLAPAYRSGWLFDVWVFQRGLTSCLFLLLSGFAFSIASARHWAAQLGPSPALWKRLRRFSLFIILGYALHFPVARFVDLRTATPEQWRTFLAVDVLQLIGAAFFLVQALVMIARSRRVFMSAALVLAIVVALITPWVWSIDWFARLPLAVASYLSPAAGSQFPLPPWVAYILIGAGLGQIYSRWGAANLRRYANLALLLPGAVALAIGLSIGALPESPFGEGPWSFVPPQVFVRAGSCLVILGVVAQGSRRLSGLPHVFGAMAQETLLIYFVHLCIVYGSIWNRGLAQMYGATFTPREMVVTVLLLVAAMTALAWYWNWWKHTRPRLARWTAVGAGAVLVYQLL